MKRPIFFTSFFSMNLKGSKFRTSAAIWQANSVASNAVMRSTPLLPASSALPHFVGGIADARRSGPGP